MMVLGTALRVPTMQYDGPPDQRAYLQYVFAYLGAFSDIAALYFRDHLWDHPLPYVQYDLEYPVGIGMLIWLLSLAGASIGPYMAVTAVALMAAGLVIFWLSESFEEARPWLLALSPTLPLYTVLNWDAFAIALLIAALALFRRDHDALGAGMLGVAVWTKFFPILVVPLVLLERALRRRWRDAGVILAVLGLVSVGMNAPFALEPAADSPSGFRFRESWLYFFRYSRDRPREVSLWNFLDSLGLTTEQINTSSAVLLVLGMIGIMLLMWRTSTRRAALPHDLLLPASLAAIGWLFFINKVYSPQYSLWLAVLMALLGAPSALAVAFASAELPLFGASFIALFLYWSLNPALPWFFDQVLLPVMVWHEATVLAIVIWAARRIGWPKGGDVPEAKSRGAGPDG
jgi:uncharacterized membrane protein